MDHLPQPSSANRSGAASVPPSPGITLLGNVHDGFPRGSFEEYPVRRGTLREQLLNGDFPPEKSQEVAVLVQNWLFFGLLEEAFQTLVPTADFTQSLAGSRLVLSTRRLPEYIKRWEAQVTSGQVEGATGQAQWAAQLRSVYREVVRQLLHVQTLIARYPHGFVDYLNPLAVLVETLQCHTTRIFRDGAEHEPLAVFLSPEARQNFIDQGWCPYTLANFLLPLGSPSVFEYARSFGHRPSFIEQDHPCTENDCVVATIDPATYGIKHRRGYCEGETKCEVLLPDMGVISASLRSGKVPVVTYTDEQGLITDEAVDGRYVAISHVWVDGMGSISEKGLPKCHVKFLSEAVMAAHLSIRENEEDDNEQMSVVPFWVDSLSVPGERDLRNEAIVQMSATYAAAAAVLVVDASMMHLSITDSMVQQVMVLYVSGWVRRMWTLPEALLSRQLFFRLSDGIVDCRNFFRAADVVGNTFSDPVSATLLAWLTQLIAIPLLRSAVRLGALTEMRPPSLDDVALHLAKRTSSRIEDEILAVAALFDLDVRPYLQQDRNERMANFLAEYNGGKVPSDIIFLDGFKLPFEGFGWAPQTFMKRQLAIEMKGTGLGSFSYITEQGLVGQYYSLCIDHEGKGMNEDSSAGRNYRLCVDEKEILMVIFNRSIDTDDDSPDYHFLLLPRPMEKGEEFLAAAVQSIGSMEVEGENLIHVELVCYVHVFHEDCISAFDIPPLTRHGSTSTRFYVIS